MKQRTPKVNAKSSTWRAELRFFSGRLNPVWKLDQACIEAIQKCMRDHRGESARIPRRPPTAYRGIRIWQHESEYPKGYIRLFQGSLENTAGGVRCGGAGELEERAFDAMPGSQRALIDKAPFGILRTEQTQLYPIDGIKSVATDLRCASAPRFQTGGPFITYKMSSNCYNYGLNQPAESVLGTALPAGLTRMVSAPQFLEAFQSDGLLLRGRTSLGAQCPERGTHYIAVVLREASSGTQGDFHVLRLDSNGRWSHKDGQGKVRSVDDAYQPILDLREAKFKWRSQLLAFFEVPEDITIDSRNGRVAKH